MKTLMLFFCCIFPLSVNTLAEIVKSDTYKSFSITSKKMNKEMSDEYIINNLMCRSTQVEIAKNLELLQNYDLLDSNRTDGSMAMTIFSGKSQNKNAEITLLVDSKTHVLFEIWVNGNQALKCNEEVEVNYNKYGAWDEIKPLYIFVSGDVRCFESQYGMLASPWGNQEQPETSQIISNDGKSMALIGKYKDGSVTQINHYTSMSECDAALNHEISSRLE